LKRHNKRPRMERRDRLFWIALRTIWKNWKSALVIVRPETVVSWQRQRFKRYWWRLSQAKGPGRPPMSPEIRKLVRTMATANPLWDTSRIHGELLKLGAPAVTAAVPEPAMVFEVACGFGLLMVWRGLRLVKRN